MAGLDIRVALGSSRPIYRQIIDAIRGAVASGSMKTGDAMPSVRQLAAQLVVNHNTVAKAYAELVRDGVLEGQQGRGVFVAKRRSIYTAAERKRRLEAALDVFLSEVLTLGYTSDQVEAEVRKRMAAMELGENS